jgi:hypothetical protein
MSIAGRASEETARVITDSWTLGSESLISLIFHQESLVEFLDTFSGDDTDLEAEQREWGDFDE